MTAGLGVYSNVTYTRAFQSELSELSETLRIKYALSLFRREYFVDTMH